MFPYRGDYIFILLKQETTASTHLSLLHFWIVVEPSFLSLKGLAADCPQLPCQGFPAIQWFCYYLLLNNDAIFCLSASVYSRLFKKLNIYLRFINDFFSISCAVWQKPVNICCQSFLIGLYHQLFLNKLRCASDCGHLSLNRASFSSGQSLHFPFNKRLSTVSLSPNRQQFFNHTS